MKTNNMFFNEGIHSTMEFIYKRSGNHGTNPKYHISGILVSNSQTICDVEENTRTALPAGEYRIVRHYCKQYGRHMPLIAPHHPESPLCQKELITQNSKLINRCAHCQQIQDEGMNLNTVLPQRCPMLKPGNGVYNRTDGSIILGTRIVPGYLSHPIQAFNPLAERIRKALSRGKVIILKITEQ